MGQMGRELEVSQIRQGSQFIFFFNTYGKLSLRKLLLMQYITNSSWDQPLECHYNVPLQCVFMALQSFPQKSPLDLFLHISICVYAPQCNFSFIGSNFPSLSFLLISSPFGWALINQMRRSIIHAYCNHNINPFRGFLQPNSL